MNTQVAAGDKADEIDRFDTVLGEIIAKAK
jgi:hypothetical protein